MPHKTAAAAAESFVAERWMRQLLRYRYYLLLERLKTQFPVESTQFEALNQKILNNAWIDEAFKLGVGETHP